MSTRPRISFDSLGRCNACQWREQKPFVDWSSRIALLESTLNAARGSGAYDCVVPVSGGKDGSYVAFQLKSKYGMNPLTVTIRPPLPLPLGEQNLTNFINSGFDNVTISPNPDAMRRLNRHGFIEKGFPYYGWLVAIQAGVLRTAANFGISLIFYGEDGEVEYGGTEATAQNPFYDIDYMKRVYLEGGHTHVLSTCGVDPRHRYFFEFPSTDELPNGGLKIAHWSYFENWDPYRNYMVAREQCGLLEAEETNSGTFTNFAQNDQMLYALHAYVMYLKFGFGRATQDAGIEIRRGSMTRDQGIQLVGMYDGRYPEEFHEAYLDYFEMSESEFRAVLDGWTNWTLFERSEAGPVARFRAK